ncbi:DUF4145 domain-containing protein [Neisseria zalophi]|uniref:DUF4145 domain-containing protein n=1 Tax=Neisseria zalophi TaxID=640030 RepID=A0A5J6PWS6_9NEIS|nr:DUF4145 domain-containing protein [Neisseria zalophi]QEY25190.1 DUF4145 domain-containing protein [Neisseria zalophi]
MQNYISPEFDKRAFHCPHCGVYSHMDWNFLQLEYEENSVISYKAALCDHCRKFNFWKVLDITPEFLSYEQRRQITPETVAKMVYPDIGLCPLPEPDMPDDVKQDYEEAAGIFAKSPRGAAALLRLGFQKLCIHLGASGDNINKDIKKLASQGILSHKVTQMADIVRITGNNAVHPGQLADEDFDKIAEKLFYLINWIVKECITKPKELEEIYNMMPEGARKAVEKRDNS